MQLLRVIVAVVSLAMPAYVWPQSIGVYADAEATDTDICIPVGVPVRVYLAFREADSPGITGFEFRVVGLPSGWIAIADYCGPVVCPAMDLFGSGATWAWPTCQTGDRVTLGTALIVAIEPQSSVEFQIAARLPPSKPAFDCALITRCDAPAYTRQCVTGGRAMINHDDCPVGVQQYSWSALKGLYE